MTLFELVGTMAVYGAAFVGGMGLEASRAARRRPHGTLSVQRLSQRCDVCSHIRAWHDEASPGEPCLQCHCLAYSPRSVDADASSPGIGGNGSPKPRA